jgi:hypothetical protein
MVGVDGADGSAGVDGVSGAVGVDGVDGRVGALPGCPPPEGKRR